MSRKLAFLLSALALVLAASTAQAAGMWSIMVGGGMAVPMGNFGDESNSGALLGGAVDYGLSDMIAVGVDVNWNSNEHKDVGVSEDIGGGLTVTLDEDKFSILQFGAHARVMPPMSGVIKPYGLLGLGIYSLKEKYKYTVDDGVNPPVQSTEEDDEANGFFEQIGSRMGGKIGAGAMYQINEQVGAGLEICYNYITLDKDTAGESSASFVGVHAGVMFHIMPK